jgi:hypothetical protein
MVFVPACFRRLGRKAVRCSSRKLHFATKRRRAWASRAKHAHRLCGRGARCAARGCSSACTAVSGLPLLRDFLQIPAVDFSLYILRIVLSYPLFVIVGDHAPLRDKVTEEWRDPRILMLANCALYLAPAAAMCALMRFSFPYQTKYENVKSVGLYIFACMLPVVITLANKVRRTFSRGSSVITDGTFCFRYGGGKSRLYDGSPTAL